ncbi:hypothetical protein HLH33_18620 [Gluconacetobacter diazotrophicus]|uniref:Uncharacterized protein n=1 Tax=Gluconacetobacter diazotrophicus TaxID=33996 RepID=A0A7W4NIC6_GLUDI|nr:hypothetical protein [Gluconacetobacter diazotrophicus]MBB2158279.1 hypothetical protein [Gluconacetobacter diazotrophicus]
MPSSKTRFRNLLVHGLFAALAAGFAYFYVSFAVGRQSWDAFRAAAYIFTFQAFVYARLVPNEHPSEFMGKYRREITVAFFVFFFGFLFSLFIVPDTPLSRIMVGALFSSVCVLLVALHIAKILKSCRRS